MGGLDIFYADKKDGDEFEAPVNIGFPINTTNDETFFYPVSKNVIYMAVWPEGRIGNRSIVRITIKDTSKTSFYIPENAR
jgi:hypothetical protein